MPEDELARRMSGRAGDRLADRLEEIGWTDADKDDPDTSSHT